jgi:hypothetical protein
MTTKARYDAAHTKFVDGKDLQEVEMWDIFEYVKELEEALHQEGHIVEFDEDGFALLHPVGCRKAGMLNCTVWAALDALPDTPVGYGKFPVALDDKDELVFMVPPQGETVGLQIVKEQ